MDEKQTALLLEIMIENAISEATITELLHELKRCQEAIAIDG